MRAGLIVQLRCKTGGFRIPPRTRLDSSSADCWISISEVAARIVHEALPQWADGLGSFSELVESSRKR